MLGQLPYAFRDNNFNMLRLVAASLVTVEHAYHFIGLPDPVERIFGLGTGWMAVSVFFMMSGYLIHRSIISSRDVKQFMLNRNLRILPGLWVMLVMTTVFLGVFESTVPLSEFFRSPHTWSYVFGNAALYFPHQELPGVFHNNPLTAVNGSLWTLRFEYTCYLVILVLFIFGILSNKRYFVIFCIVFAFVYLAVEGGSFFGYGGHSMLDDTRFLPRFSRLFLAFLMGTALSVFYGSYRIRGWHVGVTFLLLVPASFTFLYEAALTAFMAVGIFYFAYLQLPELKSLRTMPDISYGMYIYAFPIQQILVAHYPELYPALNALFSILIAAIPATISWFVIEKPALSLKALRRAPAAL
ncbi:acyltransferase family protein [Xanthobacter flavus]|uniref:acyltransferase family protein n=1 Tax=Xanthobacter flavus TaxID=281 RepID=UPI003728FF94